MANTYTLISSNTLASTTASVTFSSIPSTYTDLLLKFSARSTYSSSGVSWLFLTFNGATTNFSTTLLENAFGSVQSQSFVNSTAIYGGYIPNLSYTSNIFGTGEYYIPSYTASQNKPISISEVLEQSSSSGGYVSITSGLWQSTSAITSLTLKPELGSLASGSSFYLYGIKNS